MINKELKLKYIKSLKSGGRVPKYQTAWGKLDKQDELDDWTRHWGDRLKRESSSKIVGGWKLGSRNGHVESDEEYTARRTKEEQDAAKKKTKHIKKAADTAHMIGTLALPAGIAASAAAVSLPATLGGIAGGVAGEKAVDYGLGKLADMTGSKVRSWKDLTDKYLGWSPTLQMITNPGTIIGGGIGSKGAQLSKGAMDYLIAMNNLNKGLPLTTRYYFKPGYLGANGVPIGKVPEVPEGWQVKRPVVLNGQQTWLVEHPKWGFSTLEEVNGSIGKGQWAREVTNEALDNYNPSLRKDPGNKEFINELRWLARRMDSGKETPGIINNTEEYPLYPKLWNVVLKTERGKQAYPYGATMVGRGIWPGSSQIVESSNYPALFLGYNRDMGMPYSRIGTNLGGQNNFGPAQYEKFFDKKTVKKLKEIDTKLSEYLDGSGHYSPEYSKDVYKLHHQRNLLLGDKAPEFGGFQQLLIPNDKYGDMLRTTITKGLKTGAKWEDMNVTVPALTGEEIYTDPDLIAKALAENGERMGINGVHVTNVDPTFGGFHDKGLGTEVIWGQHGSAPYLKNVYGNSFKNLLGTIELGYKKGGKIKIKK